VTFHTKYCNHPIDCSLCPKNSNSRGQQVGLSHWVVPRHGAGGQEHLFHRRCLRVWINRCNEEHRKPTCPRCHRHIHLIDGVRVRFGSLGSELLTIRRDLRVIIDSMLKSGMFSRDFCRWASRYRTAHPLWR
jgi:hypothetical protein